MADGHWGSDLGACQGGAQDLTSLDHVLSDIDELLFATFHSGHSDADVAAHVQVAQEASTDESPTDAAAPDALGRKRTFSDVCATADISQVPAAGPAATAKRERAASHHCSTAATAAATVELPVLDVAAASAMCPTEERSFRKKTRERERRQEVNDKFEELFKLVTAVEADLGLKREGSGAAGGSNRVELLARAIAAMRRLWSDCGTHRVAAEQLREAVRRMELLATNSAAGTHPQQQHAAEAAAALPAAAGAAGSGASGKTPVPQAAAGSAGVAPAPSHMPMMAQMSHEGAAAVAAAAAAAAGHPFAAHHVAGMPGMPNMPMLIVPMFMPQQHLQHAHAGHMAPQGPQGHLSQQLAAPEGVAGPAKDAANGAPRVALQGKPGFPPGFGHFMPVPMPPMPQFALRALREDGPEEKPTHAVCA